MLNIFHFIIAEVVQRHLRSLNSSKTPLVSALYLSSSSLCWQYKDTIPQFASWVFIFQMIVHNITRASRFTGEKLERFFGEGSQLAGAGAWTWVGGGGDWVLPTMAYMGSLHPNGVPFSSFRYIKG